MCKGISKLFFFLLLIQGSLTTWAQPNQGGGVPLGLLYPEIQNNISFIELVNDDLIYRIPEWNRTDSVKDGTPMQFGTSMPVSLAISNDKSSCFGDHLILWQQKLKSSGAKAISLIFSRFVIPDNGKLFIYSPDGETILGYFDSKSNTNGKPFVTQFILGDEVILEYTETFDSKVPFASNSDIFLSEIIHAFRGFDQLTKGEGDSGGCQVNINCPEGNDWQTQKRGVAKLYLRKGTSWYNCTGTLVNNTSQDGEPYFLTADHCGGDASEDDRSVWQFYFGFERTDCDNSANPVNSNYVVGCSLVSRAPLDGGSDFQLVKLSQELPRNLLPFFNGWDRSLTASQSGVGIHHPSGDVKKISTYTRTLTTTTPNIGGDVMAVYSAWRVYWARTETNFGVTENGSSGSPLFTSNGNIVGTLSGGNSSCSNPIGADFYGKFNFHWASNGSDNSKKLQSWLDPLELNTTILNGFDPLVPKNLTAEVDDKLVNLSWEPPLINSDLVSYNIYEDNELIFNISSELNSFSKDFSTKTNVSFYITAIYSTPEYESLPSNVVSVDVETSNFAEDFSSDFFKIFPNPASGSITLESSKLISGVKIYTANGVLVLRVSKVDNYVNVIDISSLKSGFYLFEVLCNEGCRSIQRFIVQ